MIPGGWRPCWDTTPARGQDHRAGSSPTVPATLLARQMGADVMYGREARAVFESLAPEQGDRQVMGMSVLWTSRREPQPTPFPDIDWGVPFDESRAYHVRGGDWEWETGQYRDQAADSEAIRDYGLMTVFANWSYLKNHAKRRDEWACDTLAWVSPIGGKRESYRVVGDYVRGQNDIGTAWRPDATGTMTWNLDLHFPIRERSEVRRILPFLRLPPRRQHATPCRTGACTPAMSAISSWEAATSASHMWRSPAYG